MVVSSQNAPECVPLGKVILQGCGDLAMASLSSVRQMSTADLAGGALRGKYH